MGLNTLCDIVRQLLLRNSLLFLLVIHRHNLFFGYLANEHRQRTGRTCFDLADLVDLVDSVDSVNLVGSARGS